MTRRSLAKADRPRLLSIDSDGSTFLLYVPSICGCHPGGETLEEWKHSGDDRTWTGFPKMRSIHATCHLHAIIHSEQKNTHPKTESEVKGTPAATPDSIPTLNPDRDSSTQTMERRWRSHGCGIIPKIPLHLHPEVAASAVPTKDPASVVQSKGLQPSWGKAFNPVPTSIIDPPFRQPIDCRNHLLSTQMSMLK